MDYEEFLKNKIIIAENYGIDTAEIEYSKMLFPHQKDIVNFCLLGGLFSVAYKALEMERKATSIELNSEYFRDGLHYVKAMLYKMSIPRLFDFAE